MLCLNSTGNSFYKPIPAKQSSIWTISLPKRKSVSMTPKAFSLNNFPLICSFNCFRIIAFTGDNWSCYVKAIILKQKKEQINGKLFKLNAFGVMETDFLFGREIVQIDDCFAGIGL